MNISIYKNKHDPKGTTFPMISVIKNIRDGVYKEQIKHLRSLSKEQYDEEKGLILPAATFSGIFEPTRLNSNLVKYTSLMTIDIDGVEDRLDELCDLIKADSHTYCMFISPSGNGIKVLVPVSSGKNHHREAFECCRLYYKSNFDVDIDPSGKNEARLCYLGYDPDLYFNGKATPFPVIIDEAMAKTVYSDRNKTYGEFNITTDDQKKYEVCSMWTSFYTKYEEGARNTHIHKLTCNLNRVGVNQQNALLMILRDKTDMPVEECKEIVSKTYKANVAEHATQDVFEFEKEQDAQRGMLEFSSPADIMDRIINNPVTGLVSTGFPKRDMMFGGGLQRGSVYAYIGREKTFKSIDAIIAACHAAQSAPVLYFNGEMSELQFMQIVSQQKLGIRRIHFETEKPRVAEYFKTHLNKLCIVSGSDFTKDQAVKTRNAMEVHFKQEPELIIFDGLKQMSAGRSRESILAMIENAEVAKNIAKATNCAVIVLIHTDANCKYWNRDPRNFVLGKTQVVRNFDGTVSFSRFIEPGTFVDENTYDLKNDRYCVRVQDDRLTGDSDYVVMELTEHAVPLETQEDVIFHEVKMNEKQY